MPGYALSVQLVKLLICLGIYSNRQSNIFCYAQRSILYFHQLFNFTKRGIRVSLVLRYNCISIILEELFHYQLSIRQKNVFALHQYFFFYCFTLYFFSIYVSKLNLLVMAHQIKQIKDIDTNINFKC